MHFPPIKFHSMSRAGWLLGLAIAIIAPPAPAQEKNFCPESAWYAEGGDRAPVKVEPAKIEYGGVEMPAARLVCSRREKAYNKIYLPAKVDFSVYNTVEFKVKFEKPEAAPDTFMVYLLDNKGNLNATSFHKYARKLGDGWMQFSWDAVNQPDIVRGLSLENGSRLGISYDYGKIPEGQSVVITIIDVVFASGRKASSGDPALTAEWNRYVHDYKPDYSDSSRYLLPPEGGRLAAPLALVQSGRPAGQIVAGPHPGATLQLAASELSLWIKAITGASLPVAAGPAGDAGAINIILGTEAARRDFASDIEWLGDSDGYAVRTKNKNIYIFGSNDKGTLNGIFAFLESNTDIIWPRPLTELSAVYSEHPDLDIVRADFRDRPATRLRGWLFNAGGNASQWLYRNRNNYDNYGQTSLPGAERQAQKGSYLEYGGGHNLHGFVDKSRTEFYPTINGAKPEKLNVWKHQLCFTHPDLPESYAQNLLAYLAAKAPANIECMNVKIEDNWGVCACERCLSPITLPDGSKVLPDDPAFRSTQFFIFLNDVTRRVNAVYPKLKIGTYAYFFTATPPKVALDPHIRVYFCPYVRKDQHAPLSHPINDHWWQMINQWAKATPNVVLREYYGIMAAFRPLAEVVDFDVKSYLSRGVMEYSAEIMPDQQMIWSDGMLRGGADEWDFMAMDYWAISRIYWAPDQDVEQLRKYFLRRTYREAAPAMEHFYGAIRSRWYASSLPSDFEEPDGLMNRMVVQTGIEGELRKYLAEASASVRHPVSRMLVDRITRRFELWVRWAKVNGARKQDMQFTPALTLQFGWYPNTDWLNNTCWGVATVMDREGKTIPAVRVTVDPGRKGPAILRNPFMNKDKFLDAAGVLEMTIQPIPGDAGTRLPRPTLAIEAGKHSADAPEDAYQAQADGSWKVRWHLPAASVEQDARKGFALKLPKDALPADRQTEFYLYGISWSPDVAAR